MEAQTRHLAISRVFDAPRPLVYRAFTDPDHLATWWGPTANALPRTEMDFDVRPGGHQRWTELSVNEPDVRVHVDFTLTDVKDCELLDGIMRIDGQLQAGMEPFVTRIRVEFYDEGVGRTRLEIRQWLPPHMEIPAEQGWGEAFTKLDATLASGRAPVADDRDGVVA